MIGYRLPGPLEVSVNSRAIEIAGAQRSLEVYISRLRKTLESAAGGFGSSRYGDRYASHVSLPPVRVMWLARSSRRDLTVSARLAHF